VTSVLRDRDTRTLLLWVAAGIVGLVIAVSLFSVAQPEASIDFKVSPGDATAIARDFLKARGADVTSYESSVILKTDDDAKSYLERELGLERANALMASDVPVFAFEVRFFRDLQREEYAVQVDPAGRVIGLKHVIEEERAGARLDATPARNVADAFLKTVEPRFAGYAFLPEEQSSKERPNRRDWTFTWERTGFRAADAPYRITVTVLGDAVGGEQQFLKVPDGWKRDFDRLRSGNVLYQLIAQLAFAVLNVALVFVLVPLLRRGAVRWRTAAKLGAVLAVVFVAAGLNALPLVRASYETTTSYPGFLAAQVVLAVVAGVALAAYIAFIFAAAEPGYRERWPERLRLAAIWRPRAYGTREFFRALVIGISLGGASLGGVTLFYVIGRSVGVWAPQDIRYSDAVGTAFPWLYPLSIGVEASTNEEFLFRLFAIPLLLALTRSRAVAILVPAFSWGFLHSTYPVEPGFVRGIEVGTVGIVAGLVFLRYGLLPTLVWHYTYDAALIGLLLLRSENAYFQISGAIVGFALFVPLVAATALLLRRRRFVEDGSLLNAADPVPSVLATAPAAVVPRVYDAAGRRAILIAAAIAATGALLFVLVQPETIGSYIQTRITPREATRIADDSMRARAIDVAGYQKIATFGGMPSSQSLTRNDAPQQPATDPYANEYLRRTIGIAGVNALYAEQVPSVFWRVRYFRDGAKEEYTVLLRTDGALYTVLHALDEKTPGANLSTEEAQATTQRYLREAQRLDPGAWKVVEATSNKLPSRTDHTIVFERSDAIGDAHIRAEVKLSGDEVTSYRVFVKVPEEWVTLQKQQTFFDTASGIVRGLVAAALLVAVLVLFFRNVRKVRVPWRAIGVAAAAIAVLSLVSAANALPRVISSYPTATPFAAYVGVIAASDIAVGIFVFGAVLLAGGAAWLFAVLGFGEERTPSLRPTAAYWKDAFVLGLTGTGATLLLGRISTVANKLLPVDRRSLAGTGPSDLDTFVPGLGPIAGAPFTTALVVIAVVVACAIGAHYVRSWPLRVAALVLLAVLLAGDATSLVEFARDFVVALAQLGLSVFWVTRISRFNALSLALAFAGLILARSGVDLAAQPNGSYLANGVVVLVVAALLYAAPLLLWRRASRPA
jgi:hypothetical protein